MKAVEDDNVAAAVRDLRARVIRAAAERERLPLYPDVAGGQAPLGRRFGSHNDLCVFDPAPIT